MTGVISAPPGVVAVVILGVANDVLELDLENFFPDNY
jgi:hypothetical protein